MDDYEFNIEGSVEIKGQKSIQNTDKEIQNLADSVTTAESAVKKLNEAISSMKGKGIKPSIDLSEFEKAINAIEKRIDSALDSSLGMFSKNMAKIASSNKTLRTNEGLKAKADGYVEKQLSQVNKTFDKFADSIVSSFEKKIKEVEKTHEDLKRGFTLGASGNITSGSMSKEAFRLQKHNNGAAPLLLTSYAGVSKEAKETLAAEKKIKEAKQKEAVAAEEAAKTQEKITKKKKMTEYQEEKIKVANVKNITNIERNAIREKERKDRKEKNDRLAGFQEYKSEHPELFETGALLHSKRYQAGRAIGGIGSAVSSLGTGGKIVGGLFDALGTLVKSPVAGAATAVSNLAKGVIDLGKSATEAFAEIEAIKTQLGVVFSNQTQAESMFGQISQYAVKSPFGVQQTSELAVLLKQSGVYASDLMDTLKMLGDTAGGNMEKMKRIANNYAQIVSIGKASMLDMRQFAYAGIPIFEAVSKELGVSQQELRKLISDGKVTSDIIEKVFKDLTGINGIFENATEKGAKTLKARLQNLSDARQLAFGSIGEWGTKLGANTGGDSYVNKMVTWAENLYSYIKEHVNTINIQKDVATLANRTDRIEILKKLIEDNKNNKELRVTYEKELQAELAKRDVDLERLTYANSYDAKRGRLVRAQEALSGYSLDNAVMRFSALSLLAGPAQGQNAAKLNPYSKEYEGLNQRELENLASLFKELVDAINAEKTITEEDAKAHRESAAIEAQQLAFDRENSRADKSDSLNSKFQELLELYKGSDEYKAKEEEKRIKTLTEAKEILKQLVPKAGPNGAVDFSKFTMPEFLRYDAQGAFSSGKKFNIVNGNRPTSKEDMAVLRSQFTYAMNEAYKQASFYMDTRTALKLQSEITELNSNLNDQDYLNKFSETLTSVQDLLKTSQLPDNIKSQVLGYLVSSTVSHELTTGGENANPNDIAKGSKYDFVPLWKRILAGATGLSTQGMTGTLQTMENYKNDMAVRNMASNVLKATMSSMGVDSAMGLIKTAGNAKQLRGDTGATFQVDWKSTREAIKKFSLALSASTDVITAYKNSLEQELDTYEQLIAAGYTEAESQDLKNQKTISTKALEKLSMDAGDQLVNAFGEGLMTKSGIKAFFNGSEFVDSQGNKLEEEEVIMTGNLYNFIKEQLPRIYDELHEANITEAKNKVLNSMFSQAAPTQLASKFLTGNNLIQNTQGKHLDAVRFLQQYPDFANQIIDSSLTRNKGAFPALNGLTNTQILAYAYRTKGTGGSKAENDTIIGANAALTNAFAELENAILDLVNSDVFSNLEENLKNKARDEDVMKRYLANQWAKTNGLADQNNLTPENYGGTRGLNNRLYKYVTGQELSSDQLDYIATKLRAEKDTVANINAKRQAAYDKLSPEKQAATKLELISEEDLDPLKKTNEALAKMLSLSEQIALTWGEEGGEILGALDGIGMKAGDILRDFTSSALTSTLETWGKTLATSADDSAEIGKNLAAMSASMLKNMGSMITQAGLSLAISSVGDKKKVLLGLAIAAAGGGLSFLGGYLDGETEDSSKEDDEYQKLLKIKQDLSDLLKQAREDAIYYENTVRHKKAISANENFTKSVHDAIITPRGDVVTTDPKDYLIATKTPRTLVGGGAPTINFSVVDKSTGVRVTQQRSSYDEESNTINFEAIIESKVQEVIATSKGDEAFNAREARLNGRTVIA